MNLTLCTFAWLVILPFYQQWQGLRPELPENTHPRLVDLMRRCWDASPAKRPFFSEITSELEELLGQIQVVHTVWKTVTASHLTISSYYLFSSGMYSMTLRYFPTVNSGRQMEEKQIVKSRNLGDDWHFQNRLTKWGWVHSLRFQRC